MRCKSILIIEDDKAIRETLQVALELEGYEVKTAANGLEGVQALEKMPRPCLILLDLMMPVMDGWGFMSAIEHSDTLAAIPVVIVTAYAEKAGDFKERKIIKKPIDMDLFFQVVNSYCG